MSAYRLGWCCKHDNPPIVMEMQIGSTNSHISQIFFVFAAKYWWDWLAAPVLMVRYKMDCHVNSTSPNQ
jgi:hypothetical protein